MCTHAEEVNKQAWALKVLASCITAYVHNRRRFHHHSAGIIQRLVRIWSGCREAAVIKVFTT